MMLTNIHVLSSMLLLITISLVKSSSFENNNSDPFAALGIPDLSPKKVMEEIDKKANDPRNNKGIPQLRSMEDLPNFLKLSSINEEEGIKILTRFLIQDDYTLKKYGVVYDQTGFDGLGEEEIIAPIGTEERLNQRAKSSANIWFKEKYPKLSYESYGTDPQMDEIVPNWRVFKVLMIGGKGETTYLKVCLPLDESETALVGDKDDPCLDRANFVDKEKDKNEDYINKIKTNNFFKKKKNGNGLVKLLPGEKMVIKDKNKNIVLDSNSFKQSDNEFLNPPGIDNSSDNPYLAAIKNKKSMLNMNNKYQMNKNMNNMMNNYMTNNFKGQNMNPNQFLQNKNFQGMNMNNNFRFNQLGNQINNDQYNNQMNNSFGNYRFNSNNNFMNTGNKGTELQKQDASALGGVSSNANLQNSNINTMNQMNSPDSQIMIEFKQLKEQMMKLSEELKQKDEIIKQQNTKFGGNFSKLDSSNVNPSSKPIQAPESNPLNSSNQNQIQNSIPNTNDSTNNVVPLNNNSMMPDNNSYINTNYNNMGFNQVNAMGFGMNGLVNNQNFNNPMNQFNNFIPQQNPDIMSANNGIPNLGNSINPMMQLQNNQMRQFDGLPQQQKNLREVL